MCESSLFCSVLACLSWSSLGLVQSPKSKVYTLALDVTCSQNYIQRVLNAIKQFYNSMTKELSYEHFDLLHIGMLSHTKIDKYLDIYNVTGVRVCR